jgi:hypothetical protein
MQGPGFESVQSTNVCWMESVQRMVVVAVTAMAEAEMVTVVVQRHRQQHSS